MFSVTNIQFYLGNESSSTRSKLPDPLDMENVEEDGDLPVVSQETVEKRNTGAPMRPNATQNNLNEQNKTRTLSPKPSTQRKSPKPPRKVISGRQHDERNNLNSTFTKGPKKIADGTPDRRQYRSPHPTPNRASLLRASPSAIKTLSNEVEVDAKLPNKPASKVSGEIPPKVPAYQKPERVSTIERKIPPTQNKRVIPVGGKAVPKSDRYNRGTQSSAGRPKITSPELIRRAMDIMGDKGQFEQEGKTKCSELEYTLYNYVKTSDLIWSTT